MTDIVTELKEYHQRGRPATQLIREAAVEIEWLNSERTRAMTALEDERTAHWVCVKMRDDALAEVERLRAALYEIENHPNVSAVIKLRARVAQTPIVTEQVKTAGED